jgi:hypothetical protein
MISWEKMTFMKDICKNKAQIFLKLGKKGILFLKIEF